MREIPGVLNHPKLEWIRGVVCISGQAVLNRIAYSNITRLRSLNKGLSRASQLQDKLQPGHWARCRTGAGSIQVGGFAFPSLTGNWVKEQSGPSKMRLFCLGQMAIRQAPCLSQALAALHELLATVSALFGVSSPRVVNRGAERAKPLPPCATRLVFA
jgi:hypothetical protein